jgi:predicted RNA-binding Zn-ribbon protein involved in translation (DUF1610 family)
MIFIDVENCPACGNDHIEVYATELFPPVSIDNHEYNFMLICPDCGDSVYVNNDSE